MQKKWLPTFIFLILFLISGFLAAPKVFAQSSVERYNEIQKQIEKTQAKISELQETERNLSQQISLINTQIRLTELKIQEAQAKIDQLEKEINVLGFRIEYISESLEKLQILIKKRIIVTYEQSFISNLELMLTSRDFSDLILRFQYLKQVQENDKRLFLSMQQTKTEYANQKDDRETKQAQILGIKKQLDASVALLDHQKKEKDNFLAVTKNDEASYQEELKRLQADAASISLALGNVGARIGTVAKSDIIASVGSSGCSTGPHLHFEVFTDAKVEDGKIIGNRVDPKPYLDDGKYEKPVPNYPGNVTTWYGEVYFLGVHTGIDIANSFGTSIRAIDGGEAYFTQAPCSYNIPGGTPLGKGIVVDHKNGLVTLYWHIP
ncbi:hypothetical protein HYU92_05460 [Candidatus Curtissbacteria bacterium]|nr:hypothetical protein [Candidatus Curtissbacteria bacterium]